MKNNLSNKILLCCVCVFSIAMLFLYSKTVLAEEVPPTTSTTLQLSEEKRGLISQNCGTIRQSLKILQHSDSRARTYFGNIYETIFSGYLTPLNLRLVKNNISSISLIELQTSIDEKRKTFSADFVSYSKSLEELIAIDCRLEPDSFYNKLLDTRAKRSVVAEDMKKLDSSFTSLVELTQKLKESL